MATHSSILAWKIPWTGEPGGLQFMGPLRVGQDWATNTQATSRWSAEIQIDEIVLHFYNEYMYNIIV